MYVEADILVYRRVGSTPTAGFPRGDVGLDPLCDGTGLAEAEDAAAWSLLSMGPDGGAQGMLATEEAALLDGVCRRREAGTL